MIASHSGDLGDLIAAMSIFRDMAGGDLVLFPTNTRERMSPARVANIGPLLLRQHYVKSVTYSDHPANPGLNLDAWRYNYKNGLNLCDMYYSWISRQHPDRDQPWLWCHEPNHVADVVFCRSARYQGTFPWKRAVKKYRGCSVFLGTELEHETFCRDFGDIPYHPTPDLWEAARIVQASKLVLVNQTCLFWLAEALKRPLCLEASGSSNHGLRNCHVDRTGSIYGTHELLDLPDIDLLDERLAYVCAERDIDRSLLGSKRLPLARAALSVADLPGDAAEVGVFRGGSAAILSAAMPSTRLHLFDTFTGIPQTEPGGHTQGDFSTDLNDVKHFLSGYNVEFHVGFFPATATVEDRKFKLVHLDGDLYQTTADGLDFFLPRMTPGGIIILDDVDWKECPGVRRAIEERNLSLEVDTHQGIIR